MFAVMIENFSNIIEDIKTGKEIEAFEAAKRISCTKLSKTEFLKLSNIVSEGIEPHNKEAATYAISWIENKSSALAVLISILSTTQNHEVVRGQAAEGIGIINPSRKYKMRMAAEEILLKSLKDSSPIVRFWSCYAVGELKMKSALPILQELKNGDNGVCPGWWYVSEEAEDAIDCINNKVRKERIPINQRQGGTKDSIGKKPNKRLESEA